MSETKDIKPTITLPLDEFLKILWGYKYRDGDYRDKAVPSDVIIKALEAIPKEIAERYFVIRKPLAYVDHADKDAVGDKVVWSPFDWKTSAQKDEESKTRQAHENYAADHLTDFLHKKYPLLEKTFLRQLALQVVNQKNYDVLIMLNMTPTEIEDIKKGTYLK